MLTSIIILNYDLCEVTRTCIDSIRKYTPAGSYEIIVVDNGSTDNSVEYLRQQSDVKLIVNRENMGFPRGCNQGLAVASGDELLLLNNDTVVTPRWLENLRHALYSAENIGAVGPMTNKSENMQRVDIPYANENTPEALQQIEKYAAEFNQSNPAKWHIWQMLTGFCLLFKREVYEKIGSLDEKFAPGNYEDDDYSLRIRKAGYEILLCGDTFIHHFGSQTFQTFDENKRRKYDEILIRNRRYFLDKWQLDDAYYQKYRTFLLKIDFDNKPLRIVEYSSGSTQDLYILAARCPQGMISGTTKNHADLEMGNPFSLSYTADLWEFIERLQGEYNLIIIPEDFNKIPREQVKIFSRQIQEHLTIGGTLILVSGDQLFYWRREFKAL